MASEKQIAANRRNSQRSTGPITPEGKAGVSRNAFKHGLRSRGVSFTPTAEALQAARDSLAVEWQPQTAGECNAIHQMALALLQRQHYEEIEAEWDSRSLDPEFTSALLILSRRQAAADRTYYKALYTLLKHRLPRPLPPLAETPARTQKMNEQSQFPRGRPPAAATGRRAK